jgi:hypothetical protein
MLFPKFVHTSRKVFGFCTKPNMAPNLNVQDNGSEINLPILARETLSARDIQNELVALLGLDAIADSRITRYLRQQHFPAISSGARAEPPITIIDSAILDALDQQPLSSIPGLAKLTCIPKTTLHRH